MIRFDPSKLLDQVASKKKVSKLLSQRLTLKKTALSFLDDVPRYLEGVIDKSEVTAVALKTIKGYKERIRGADDSKEERKEIKADPKQLVQRVQNQIVFQVHEQIKEKYGGKRAIWLPSSAAEPRPEHALNYGKEYIIGEGIDGVEPGDEYGCQCGVEIQTDDKKLEL